VIVTEPALAPVAVGVKVTFSVQLAPGPSGADVEHATPVEIRPKSPLGTVLVNVRALSPVLVRVTVFAGLVVLIA